MKADILKQLDDLLDDKTIAFFSVTLHRKENGELIPTITFFGMDNATAEERKKLVDAIFDLAKRMMQQL